MVLRPDQQLLVVLLRATCSIAASLLTSFWSAVHPGPGGPETLAQRGGPHPTELKTVGLMPRWYDHLQGTVTQALTG
jgi:hypothetical protein